MPHPIVTTVTAIAGVANGLALTQSLGAAGLLTLNGSLVAGGLDAPRRIIVTSAGNDSAITFNITGTARTEQGGGPLSETIAGANAGVAQTTQDFATVSSIAASGATASTVTAGTNGVASGPWVVWDVYADDFQVMAQGNVLSGSPTYQLDVTLDDVFGTWLPANVPFPRASPYGGLVGATGNVMAQITGPVRASRLTLTAFGSVQLTQQQQGN